MSKSVLLVVFLFVLFSASYIHASFNDVSLNIGTPIVIGSYTLQISGATASIESISVDSSSFEVSISSGSTFTISSTGLTGFSVSGSGIVSTISCDTPPTLSLSGIGVAIVTPIDICIPTSNTQSPPTQTSSGGGGGAIHNFIVADEVVTCPPGHLFSVTTGKKCTTTSSAPVSIPTLTRTLKLGMSGPDVKALQQYLNTKGFTISTTGPGSPGQETTLFGPKTKAAVIKFQLANKLKGDGVVGAMTRIWLK
jgi:hypothetical protein